MERRDACLALSCFGVGLGAAQLIRLALRYRPPRVWTFTEQGGKWGKLNKPTAGEQSQITLPRGKHPLQLYSLGTPNGVKCTILLEELCLKYGLEYDAWTVSITSGEQFGSDFVATNPNSKIPCMKHFVEEELEEGEVAEPIRLFETASIMLYLAEHFDAENAFLPAAARPRAECLSWVMWLQGAAPYLGGGFGHFFSYAPHKDRYAIDRYTMETKRMLSVLDRHLGGQSGGRYSGGPYLVASHYTIADMAVWPWFGNLVLGRLYSASEFLSVEADYPHVMAWAKQVGARLAVKRGRMVTRTWGGAGGSLKERHSVTDFEQFE